jgi:CTP:molybdopterin cytidylyltransferase MocA
MGSVCLAAAARPGRDLCLAPVDVPLVPGSVFAALRAEWQRLGAPPHGWLAPALETPEGLRHGHPVIVGRALVAGGKDFPPDEPLRVLRGRASPLRALACGEPAILDDLDTPADLTRLRGAVERAP